MVTMINKDLALLLATSGSTGSKKFAKITHQNIYDNTKNIIKYLGNEVVFKKFSSEIDALF